MDAYLGLDVGTTSMKAVAFDAENVELALATRPTPTHPFGEDGAEYDADELWATAAELIDDVVEQLAASDDTPVAIAVASMGEAGVLIDSAGQATGPIISWFDPRTEPQAHWWVENVGVERTQRISGLTPKAVFGAAKMLWIAENRPTAWAAGERWLNVSDWIAFKLCGVEATEYSLASRTMLFDVAGRRWSDELVEASGLEPGKLAPVVQAGTPLGKVHADASRVTGLTEDAVVGAGGQDHVCAALALGITEPGMLLDSIGTAEAIFLALDGFDETGRLAAAGVNQGAHVVPGRTYAMTGILGGGRVDARRKEVGLEWDAFLGTPEAADVIDELAIDGQGRVDAMTGAAQVVGARQLVTGGGSQIEALIERKRQLSSHPIEVAERTQTTALGAAMLARRAANE